MRSASRWSRLLPAIAVAVIGLAACDEEDKVVSPIVDNVPPTVTITSVSNTDVSLTVRIRADDYISVAFIVSEVCCDLMGDDLASDTLYTIGRTTSATLTTVYNFPAPITQDVNVTITGIGVDSSGNLAQRQTGYTITAPAP